MGISAGLGTAGLQPAVCTSTTRPAAPYAGQMIFETDTNRVVIYKGSSWVYIADADTPPGLELVTYSTFTSSSTINVSGCFSSVYVNYRVLISIDTASTQATRNITWKFRTTSGDDSSAEYYYGFQGMGLGDSTLNQVQGSYGATSAVLCNYYGYTDSTAAAHLDIFSPFDSAQKTKYLGNANGGNASSQSVGVTTCQMLAAKSHTGFSFFSSTGTISGHYAVYGYRN